MKVIKQLAVFYNMRPCRLIEISRLFGRTQRMEARFSFKSSVNICKTKWCHVNYGNPNWNYIFHFITFPLLFSGMYPSAHK